MSRVQKLSAWATVAAALLVSGQARGDDLVLTPPPNAAADDKNDDFRAELGKLVKEFAQGPWSPYYRSANVHYRIYFYQPYETVLSVSRALPYLEAADRQAAITALDAFVDKFTPLTRASVLSQAWGGGPVADLGDQAKSGRWRGWSAPPPATDGPGYNFWPAPEVPSFALYAIWAYAHYADKKAYVDAHWSDIQDLYSKSKGEPQGAELWASTGAMIGAARLAAMHGDSAMSQEAAAFALAGLSKVPAVASHVSQYSEGRRVQTLSVALTGYDMKVASEEPRPVQRSLAREVLMAIGVNPTGRTELTQLVTHYEHRNDYTFGGNPLIVTELVDWAATEHGGFSGSEGGALAPEVSWAFFLAHAYGLGTNEDTLRPWLDVSWCHADLMQMDKLVAAIEATPGNAAPPPPDYDAGPPGTAGSGGSAPGADGGSTPAASPGDADSGCGCRTAGASSSISIGVLAAAIVIALRRRRQAG